jgi:hypothetical protein
MIKAIWIMGRDLGDCTCEWWIDWSPFGERVSQVRVIPYPERWPDTPLPNDRAGSEAHRDAVCHTQADPELGHLGCAVPVGLRTSSCCRHRSNLRKLAKLVLLQASDGPYA